MQLNNYIAPAFAILIFEQIDRARVFTFDSVFSPVDGQAPVFEDVSHLVQSAVDGYNVCIFAYGQTGSGKTWTMSGIRSNPGIQPRAGKYLSERERAIDYMEAL